jgi:hypothetical protein
MFDSEVFSFNVAKLAEAPECVALRGPTGPTARSENTYPLNFRWLLRIDHCDSTDKENGEQPENLLVHGHSTLPQWLRTQNLLDHLVRPRQHVQRNR